MIRTSIGMTTFNTLFMIFLGLPQLINAKTAIRIPMGQNIDGAIELPVSQLVEDIQFIALETNAKCFMDRDISKIGLFDSQIYIGLTVFSFLI